MFNLHLKICHSSDSETHELIIPAVSSFTLQQMIVTLLDNSNIHNDGFNLQTFLNSHLGLDKISWEPFKAKKVNLTDLGDIPLNMFGTVMDTIDSTGELIDTLDLDIDKIVNTDPEPSNDERTKYHGPFIEDISPDKETEDVIQCAISQSSSEEKHENKINTNSEKRKPFVCEHCKKGFHRKHHLKTHVLIHYGIKKFRCNLCNQSFRQNGHLKIHLEEVHNSGCKSVCDICRKSFLSLRKLKYHVTHTHSETKKKYKCHICDKEFSRSKLKLHILRQHENSLPFKCTFSNCGKSFVSNYYLKRHYKSHEKKIDN